MKTPRNNNRRRTASTLAVATMLTVPMLTTTASGMGAGNKADTVMGGVASNSPQLKFSSVYVKMHESYTIAGLDDGHTIYKNAKGEHFYLDPKTGDMKFLASDIWIKFSQKSAAARGTHIKWMKMDGVKWNDKVTILGIDGTGNVVQQNSKGQKFYLNPTTGDMVFLK